MYSKATSSILLALGLLSISPSFAQGLADAQKAIRFEQYQKAKTILLGLNTSEGKYYLGDVFLKEGVLDSSEQVFMKATALDPNSPFGYIGMGRIKQAEGQPAEAHTYFLRATGLLASNYFAMVELGKAYVEEAGKTKEADAVAAIGILTKAASLKTKTDQVFLALGDAYLAKPDGENAAKSYQQAMTLAPGSAEAYARFTRLFRSARNRAVSLDYAAQGIAKDPSYGPIYREQAETYRASNNFSDAVSAYQKYLALTDRSINSRVRYIQFLYLDGNYDKANAELKDLKTALKGNFSATPAMYRLDAISKYELGMKSKDKAMLAEGLASEQKLFEQKGLKPLAIDYTYLGKLYRANGNDSLAIRTLEEAVIQDSTHADEIYPSLLDAYRAKKKFKEAAGIYGKKIEHGDTSINNYVPFAVYTYFSHDTTKYRRADAYLARVNAKVPLYTEAWVYRGYLNAGLDPETKSGIAQPYFQKVIDLAATDTVFQKKIASNPTYKNYLIKAYEYMLYYKFQKKDKAGVRQTAEKLIALDPNNTSAEAVLKQKAN